MHRLAILVLLLASVSASAQSLGDVARESRERPKHAAKTITEDDLKPVEPPAPTTPVQHDLDRMRAVFREICDDPRTKNGTELSDYDHQIIDEAVKPLRARKNQWEQVQKDYKDKVAALETEMDSEVEKMWPKGRPATESDMARMKAINEDYDGRRKEVRNEAERVLQPYFQFGRDLEEVGKECPAAAKSVPD